MIRALSCLTLAVMGIDEILGIDRDDDLIAQIVASQAEGDRDEAKRLIEVVYRWHSPAVYARLSTLAASSHVDDLAQETWTRILKKLHLYKKDKGNFRAWALTIARNCWVDWVRSKRPSTLKAEAEVPDGSVDREREYSKQSEWAQILRNCLAKLNDRQRGVIVGLVYEAADHQTVCLKLGITANEAYKLKHEAKGLLTDCCRRANR